MTRHEPRTSGAKRQAKADLPSKPCAACGRPFAWRKKWERCWDEVKFCSQRCRHMRRTSDHAAG